MTQSADVLRTHPHQPPAMDTIIACVEACFACAQACNACADACLSEDNVTELRECIRLNLDCADVCAATGAVVSRLTRPHKTPMQALLRACVEACRTCAEICESHASMHAHCDACAKICRACEKACMSLLEAIP